jgi:hypothetical protein
LVINKAYFEQIYQTLNYIKLDNIHNLLLQYENKTSTIIGASAREQKRTCWPRPASLENVEQIHILQNIINAYILHLFQFEIM